jgi:hypothetical protein
MPNLPMDTRFQLSAINGLVTGAIAAWIYATLAGHGNDFWRAVPFHPLHYVAMFLVCSLNTFGFFGLLTAWGPIRRWKGFLLGGLVAMAGSFLCSLVMGIGTGRALDLLFATAFFLPLSALVGSIAGLVLAHRVRDLDEPA